MGQGRRKGQAQVGRERCRAPHFQPVSLDLTDIPALAQGAAGRDKTGGREDAGTGADRDIADRILDEIVEQVSVEQRTVTDAGFDAGEDFRFQVGIGFGNVVADAERAVKLVERWRAEAGIGGRADGCHFGQGIVGAEAAGRNDIAARLRRQVEDGQAGRQVALMAMAVIGFPLVDAQGAGHGPRAARRAALAVEADQRSIAAGLAKARGGRHIAVIFLGLAAIGLGIDADFPFLALRLMADGPGDAVTGRRGRDLVVGKRGRHPSGRHRDRAVGEVRILVPDLHTETVGIGGRGLGKAQAIVFALR